MKKLIFKMFYKLSEWIERMLKVDGERWEYERAPYCGYHECGHSGKLTHSYHYEGDGVRVRNFIAFDAEKVKQPFKTLMKKVGRALKK